MMPVHVFLRSVLPQSAFFRVVSSPSLLCSGAFVCGLVCTRRFTFSPRLATLQATFYNFLSPVFLPRIRNSFGFSFAIGPVCANDTTVVCDSNADLTSKAPKSCRLARRLNGIRRRIHNIRAQKILAALRHRGTLV